MLAALAVPVALGGAAWRSDGAALRERAVLPRLERRVAPALRWSLGAPVWVVAAALAGLWAVVPLASLLARDARGISLEHWAVLATAAGARTLGNSVALGMGAAIGGTALALAAAWIVERQRGAAGRTVELLMRVPIVIPGLVAGVGYALVFAAPLAGFAATLPILIVLVACWELPLTARAAQATLVRSDRSVEEAAVSLGAGALTTLVRVVAPALRPVAGWMAGRLFAAGVVAVGTVIVLAGAGRELGAVTMLTLAATGATGAACAVATALVVLASGAVLLGRAIAGHHHGPTLLA
jgi:ABC-type Fe3+ transport system permease subunit